MQWSFLKRKQIFSYNNYALNKLFTRDELTQNIYITKITE